MAFVVETGAGLPNANAYVPVAFVDAYLAERGRSADGGWQTKSPAQKQHAIVAATTYIDNRWGGRFKGTKARTMVDGRAARGTLTLTVLPTINQTVTVGMLTYRFVDVLAQANDVLRGVSPGESAMHLAAAIASGASTSVAHSDTGLNYEVVATSEALVVWFEAYAPGTSANIVPLATTVTGAALSAATLTGGMDEGPQALEFPRNGVTFCDGTIITGIPWKLKAATAEYAVRALVAQLDPDLPASTTGAAVQRVREKVGPIEEETEYALGGTVRIYRDYPAADRLLSDYLRSRTGEVIR